MVLSLSELLSSSAYVASFLTGSLLALLGVNLGVLAAMRAAQGAHPDTPVATPPADADAMDWPHVLVQIPICNEGALVERIIRAAAQLDYPRDRLSIQVLDDSTDGSSTENALGCRAIADAAGVRIEVLNRLARTGYKAGALAEGLARSSAEYVAVFDADFVPPRDFLRRAIVPMLDDPSVAFVQARWTHANASDSLLTRAQAALLDAHFLVEQPARWRSSLTPAFNGTCGVWRTAAIAEAGGWQGDTLTEDLDLSLRAQLAGRRGVFMESLAAPGELLVSARAWQQQQFRWSKGYAQVLVKLWSRILRAPWPVGKKAAAAFQAGHVLFFPIAGVHLLLSLPLVISDLTFSSAATHAVALLGLVGFLGATSFLVLGRRLAGKGWIAAIFDTLIAMTFVSGLLISNGRAVVEGLIGKPSPFERSSKPGASAASAPVRRRDLPLAEGMAGMGLLLLLFVERAWQWPLLDITAAGLLLVSTPQFAMAADYVARADRR